MDRSARVIPGDSVRSLGGSSLEVCGHLPWGGLVSLQAEDSAGFSVSLKLINSTHSGEILSALTYGHRKQARAVSSLCAAGGEVS